METKKKRKLKKSVVFKGISLVVAAISLLMFILLVRLDIFPLKYLILAFVILALIDCGLYFLMSRKNYKLRLSGTILSIVLVIFFSVAMYYQNATLSFFESIQFLNIQTENYYVVTSKMKSYDSIDDLADKRLVYVDDRKGVNKAVDDIDKQVKLTKNTVSDNSNLFNALFNEDCEAALIEQGEYKLYEEMNSNISSELKVISTITVHVEGENITKDVKITQEPFSVYVTGIDTYGELYTVSRSDVNMVITVNPKTHQILLTSIPRDYYVSIAGSTGLKDKLTHAGLKGVETSVKTIENLLEMDINYFLRINFTSLVEIIDAIGGVDVDNPFEFTADYEENNEHIYYVFPKGTNHLDGKQALAYVRERYGLREGDVARARHQQQVLSAVIEKMSTSTILTKYSQILGSIEGDFTTNLSLANITGFIEWQLDGMPSWTVESMVLTGSDASRKTASMPDLYSSVMIPDEEVVQEAIQKINDITGQV